VQFYPNERIPNNPNMGNNPPPGLYQVPYMSPMLLKYNEQMQYDFGQVPYPPTHNGKHYVNNTGSETRGNDTNRSDIYTDKPQTNINNMGHNDDLMRMNNAVP